MNITTRQLHAFLQLARLHSFTKAAERVHISQAGLSMMIKDLEEQVGSRLFDRTTRSVTLTDAGLRLQGIAARVVDDLGQVVAELAEDSSRSVGTLRVAATPLLSATLLPPVIKAFEASHPNVQLSLADAELGEVRRQVIDGEADLGLGFFLRATSEVALAPLYRFHMMRVSPATAATAGLHAPVAWTTLASDRLIGLPPENPIQRLVEKYLQAVRSDTNDRVTFHLVGTIIAMVEAGVGSAVVPSFAMPDCLRRCVRVEPLTKPTVPIELYVARRPGTSPKPAATAFAAALRQAIPQLAGYK